MNTSEEQEQALNNKPLYVAGVGASAGGLDAISKLIMHINGVDVPLSIIVVMHLSPVHKSELTSILNKRCKWPVVTAEHGQPLHSQTIYVTPQNSHIKIIDDQLLLEELKGEYASAPSINNFLSSLAEEKNKYAIGIILSGFGNDGSNGIEKVKEAGGLTLAQLPETAEHRHMPDAAIATGKTDAVLPAEQMFDEIVQYITNSKAIASSLQKKEKVNAVDGIFELLEKRSGTDFSMYKPTTIMRRLDHRLSSLKLSSISEYYEYIKKSPRELDILFDTVLIGVTEFFRDEEAFNHLRVQLNHLVKEKKLGDTIRIWSVGCATGEEPYSIAILLNELLGKNIRQFQIQIFACDIDERAINFGRKGIYHRNSLVNMPKEWIHRYFEQRDELHYELNKEIKQYLLFARHDITNDPPFVKLDLVVCRNLLIYFNNNLQKQTFQIFHYALRPKGLLFLGKSESISVAADLFTKVNKGKIYRKADTSLGYKLKLSRFQNRGNQYPEEEPQNHTGNMSITDIAKETLFFKFQYPFVITDEQAEIKEVHGSLRLYMEMSQGAMNVNLLKMVNPELTTAIRALYAQVKKTGIFHTSHVVKFNLYDQEHYVRLKIIPFVYRLREVQYYIIIFEKVEPSDGHLELQKKLEDTDIVNFRIKELEEELSSTREHLQIFTEELESTNEELQTINEELQSANEELKSSNEELETSNEELQSANEELNTANQELRLTNDLLIEKEKELKDEKNLSERNKIIYQTIAENIPNGTVGTLNDDFEIEYVGGKGLDSISLTKEDMVGKYLPELNPSKTESDKILKALQTTKAGHPSSIEVNFENRTYTLQTIPFKLSFEKKKKIMYLSQDITDLKKNALKYKMSLEAAKIVIFEYNFEKEAFEPNINLSSLLDLGKENKTIELEDVEKLLDKQDYTLARKKIKKSFSSGIIDDEIKFKVGNRQKWIRVFGKIIFNTQNKPVSAVAAAIDISKDKKLMVQLKKSEERFKIIADTAPITIWITKIEKNCVYINKNWLQFTGSTFEENMGKGWLSFIHDDDREIAYTSYNDALINQKPFRTEYRARRHDGVYFWFLNHGIPTVDNDGNFDGFIGSFVNINEQREFRNELESLVNERTKELTNANEELVRLNLNLEEFAYMASHDLKEPLRKIRTFNSILNSNDVDSEILATYTDKIENSAARMTELINNILDYSKIEKGDVKKEKVDLDESLQLVMTDLNELIQEHSVEIKKEPLGSIEGVSIRIYQLFSNIIRNAIKFNDRPRKIIITSENLISNKLPKSLQIPSDIHLKGIYFEDNGIGFNMAKKEYIFKPFKRLNSISDYAGTGIGLAICKSIMDLHNGFIDVESTVAKGSVFKLYFPVKK